MKENPLGRATEEGQTDMQQMSCVQNRPQLQNYRYDI